MAMELKGIATEQVKSESGSVVQAVSWARIAMTDGGETKSELGTHVELR